VVTASSVWSDVARIRVRAPLVHNITNYVVMNTTANALLAIGASPVMAHAAEEVEEMVALASALVINIGTLSPPWIESMERAARAARARGVPIVLDPVGAGATTLRTRTARRLLTDSPPAVLRGNPSEILAVAGGAATTRGVDSAAGVEAARAAAHALSETYGCAVVVSGPVDLVVRAGAEIRVANGTPLLARVTGMGCTATALVGAFVAVNSDATAAAAHATAVMGIAGELAAETAGGPGTFQALFLDALAGLSEAEVTARLKVEGDETRG
jgi:hydroxyethylthiazole kinase